MHQRASRARQIDALARARQLLGTALARWEAMLWTDFVVAFFMALLLSGAFGAAARLGLLGRPPSSMQALLWIFLVILLGSWAGGVWLGRVGPTLWDISWLGFLLSALGIALLVAAIELRKPQPSSSTDIGDTRAATVVARPLIWAAAVVAAFAIVAFYMQ
jgi:hypothetical protein